MPVYDYVCKDCNKTFEKIITLTEHERKQSLAHIAAART